MNENEFKSDKDVRLCNKLDKLILFSITNKNCKRLYDQSNAWRVSKIVYKKTDEWYIEWQRVTTNDNECYNEWQQMTTSDNEWQRMTTSDTTSDNEWYNEWQRVTASDKEWQRMVISDTEWEQWYSEWKLYSTLQRMDDCHHFNDNFNFIFNDTTT